MLPRVVKVMPGDGYTAYVWYNDGAVRLYDAEALIEPGTVFEPLADMEVFRSRMAVINNTLAWDMGGNLDPYKCIDLCPDVIYRESPAALDPEKN